MKKLLLFSFMLAFTGLSLAQQLNYKVTQLNKNGTPSFIKFENNKEINHQNFFEKTKDEFKATKDDELKLISKTSDKLGFIHYKYNQYYKGIEVYGIQYIVHEKDSFAQTANGKFIPNLNLDTIPAIDKNKAIDYAKIELGLKKYRWEDTTAENQLKKRTKNPNATYYPKPELSIAPKNGDYKKGAFVLVWKFKVAGITLDKAWWVFIDANTGELVNKISMINDDSPGTALTYYNGTQNITCYYQSSSGYYLLAETQSGPLSSQQIYTLTANNDSVPSAGGNVWNTMQIIGSSNTSFTFDPFANNVHWDIENAYAFYNLFNRNSFDGNGTYIMNLVHYMVNWDNAHWDNYDTIMCYGDGDGVIFNPFGCLDVAAHEYSHAITAYSANLNYQGESGALNESFSDIMGTGIEWWVLGPNSNWTMGENLVIYPCTTPGISTSCNYLRSLSNPKSGLIITNTNTGQTDDMRQPNTYNGQYWAPTGNGDPDYGGVHTNSGVQNYWFYLLAAGGSGTNDIGNSYSVTGIGMSDALNIMYRNQTVYLIPTSDYTDAMNGSINSAIDFWGSGSQQEQSVINAWCAVGVGSCTTGINQISENINLTIFPNPATDNITIEAPQQSIIEISNIEGQLIKTLAASSAKTNIDVSTLPCGVYIVQVKSEKGVAVKKFIKE